MSKQDAGRAIQCVNALAGIEDPDAYIAWLKAEARFRKEDGMSAINEINSWKARHDELQSENARLRDALEKFTILNPAHYKDIAGLIHNATEALKGRQK
jgi:hypothetical protein